MKDMLYLGIFLAVVSAIAALGLSLTYTVTAEKIAASKTAELNLALKTILPEAGTFEKKDDNMFIGADGKKLVGACFRVYPTGYAGKIEMLVGIYAGGKVAGVQILQSSETPGLGLNAASPNFLDQFKGKRAEDDLIAKKDIKALTGATVTSNAVAAGVKEALKKFEKL